MHVLTNARMRGFQQSQCSLPGRPTCVNACARKENPLCPHRPFDTHPRSQGHVTNRNGGLWERECSTPLSIDGRSWNMKARLLTHFKILIPDIYFLQLQFRKIKPSECSVPLTAVWPGTCPHAYSEFRLEWQPWTNVTNAEIRCVTIAFKWFINS